MWSKIQWSPSARDRCEQCPLLCGLPHHQIKGVAFDSSHKSKSETESSVPSLWWWMSSHTWYDDASRPRGTQSAKKQALCGHSPWFQSVSSEQQALPVGIRVTRMVRSAVTVSRVCSCKERCLTSLVFQGSDQTARLYWQQPTSESDYRKADPEECWQNYIKWPKLCPPTRATVCIFGFA